MKRALGLLLSALIALSGGPFAAPAAAQVFGAAEGAARAGAANAGAVSAAAVLPSAPTALSPRISAAPLSSAAALPASAFPAAAPAAALPALPAAAAAIPAAAPAALPAPESGRPASRPALSALAPRPSAADGPSGTTAPAERGSGAALFDGERAADPSWWKDPSAVVAAESVPLYALRRAENDPGVGKFTDLGRHYRDVLAKQGVKAVLLLPHFAVLDDSPYAPVSLYALNEDNVDWSLVDEVRREPALLARLRAPDQARRQSVDYADVRAREGAVGRAAFEAFAREELSRGTPRAAQYRAFLQSGAGWLDEYAEFMALAKLIGKPALDWTPDAVAAARLDPSFAGLLDAHRFAQWQARRQLRDALDEVHAAGGKALFDVPMFRAKNSVDAWKRPELFADLRTRNPGIKNSGVDEDWKDLALWRWSKLKEGGYKAALDPFEHWLSFGFDGARVDALHFAYRFGNGQMASGDEPGDDYVGALAQVFSRHGAFPLAEAFEGKDEAARRFGFTTVDGDWKKVSSHDDPRRTDFLARYFGALKAWASGAAAKFVAYTLGDEWRDPFPVKAMVNGRSVWNYRIPLPSDADYASRARFDARPQLRVMKTLKDGNEWADADAVRTLLGEAADGFIKHDDGSVQIWAASMDWFLEEWGRDTFVSLPGLLLSTGRHEEAKENIRAFAKHERDGLIPNKIEGPIYNSADAPMWFIQAVKKTVAATGDWEFAKEMAPVLRRIVAGYRRGTGYERYGRFNAIKMDADGLVSTPAQATWMDADPDGKDRPVTPRDGKTVEINALWYSNLRFMADLERRAGSTDAATSDDALADKVKASFNEKFWFVTEANRRAWGGDGGALRDVVEGDPHGEAIRPNMIFAAGLGGDLLTPARRRAVVLAVTKDLLTRYGLRTLSPRDSQYRETYDTSRPASEKDLAYHQGTVWPWLIGAYADALAGVRRDQGWDEDRVRAELRGVMTPLIAAAVSRPEGSLPEVYDGGKPDPALARFTLDDPAGLADLFMSAGAPAQNPGGTRSQAWSVAEVLRTLVEKGLVPPGYDGSR
jgi:glycogen debranching enzyme